MNKHVSMKKKVLSFFLAFVILFSSMPAELFTFAFAEGEDGASGSSGPDVSVNLSVQDDKKEFAPGENARLKIDVGIKTETVEKADMTIRLSEEEAKLIDSDSLTANGQTGLSLDNEQHQLKISGLQSDKTFFVMLKSPFTADQKAKDGETLEAVEFKIEQNETTDDISVKATAKQKDEEPSTPENPSEGTDQPTTEPGDDNQGTTEGNNPAEGNTPSDNNGETQTGEGGGDVSADNGGSDTQEQPPAETTPETPATEGSTIVDDAATMLGALFTAQPALAANGTTFPVLDIKSEVNIIFLAPEQPAEENAFYELALSDADPVQVREDNTLNDLTFTATATQKEGVTIPADAKDFSFDISVKLPDGITLPDDLSGIAQISGENDATISDEKYDEAANTLTFKVNQSLTNTNEENNENNSDAKAQAWNYTIALSGDRFTVDELTESAAITVSADADDNGTVSESAGNVQITVTPKKENDPDAAVNLSVSAKPSALTVNEENELGNFTFNTTADVTADKIPEGTPTFSFALDIDLPTGISLPEGALSLSDNTIKAGEVEIATLTLPADATATLGTTSDPLTLTITQSMGALSADPLSYAVVMNGTALTVADTYNEGTITTTVSSTDDNVSVTTNSATISVQKKAAPQPFYELSVEGTEPLTPVDRKLDNFTITANANQIAETDEKSFSFELSIAFPEGISLPAYNIGHTDDTVGMGILNSIATIEPLPDNAAITGARVEGNTLVITITQNLPQTDEPATEEQTNDSLPSWSYPVTILGNALTLADDFGEGTITVNATPQDATQGTAATTATVTINPETGKLPDETEATETGELMQQIIWRDNNDEDNKRPTIEQFAANFTDQPLYFRLTEGNGRPGKWQQLTYENLGKAGMENMPTPTVTQTASGGYQLKYENLTTEMQRTASDGTLLGTTTIDWSLAPDGDASTVTPPAVDGYEVQRLEGDNTWYYVLLTNFEFDAALRWGTLGSAEGVTDETLKTFALYGVDGNPTLKALQENGKLTFTTSGSDPQNPTDGHVTISNLPKYDVETGALIEYRVDLADPEGDMEIRLDSLEEGDYFAVEFDNTTVDNHGSDKEQLHNGGLLVLTLKGTTTFTAFKEWLDWADSSNRPDLTFELWRYREGSTYNEASFVPTSATDRTPIEIELTTEQSAEYDPQQQIKLEITQPLDKYDSDGYRYIYLLREEMHDSNYEQVFGKVERDPGSGDVTTTDTLPKEIYGEKGTRAEGDDSLYNGGTLSNRLAAKQNVSLTKEWNAAAYQGYMSDVKVTFELEVQYIGREEDKGKWYKTDPLVTAEQNEITEENMAHWTYTASVPGYGPLGREVKYRWVEAEVTQDGQPVKVTVNEETGNSSFSLKHNGQTVNYTSETEVDEETGNTVITNSVADTIDYNIRKIWAMEPRENVTFNLYQIPSGSSLTDDTKPYLTFTMSADEATITTTPATNDFHGTIGVNDETGSVEKITANDANRGEDWQDDWQETWRTVIRDLPRFDDNGREYEYLLLEQNNEGSDYFPTYETTRDDAGNYYTDVINAPGTGTRIMVRKEWLDDSDSAHRGDVTIQAYKYNGDRDNPEDIQAVGKPVTLKNGVWTALVDLPDVSEADVTNGKVFILETKVGDTQVPRDPYTIGEETANTTNLPAKAPEAGDVYQYETEHHRYEAVYSGPQTINGEQTFTVTNRRLGNIDLTVTKTWNDGDGKLREALNNLPAEYKVTPTIELEFGNGFTPDENDKIGEDFVTIGGQDTPILNKDGSEGSSSQEISLDTVNGNTQEIYFFNLPKYDPDDGSVATYQVREVWKTPEGDKSTREMKDYVAAIQEDFDGKAELLALLGEFSSSISYGQYQANDEAGTVAGNIQHDTQPISVTNGLGNTKDVKWYKQWNDMYTYEQNQRPDLYLDIYRVVHKSADADNTEVELVRANYHWDPLTIEQEPTEGEDDGVGDQVIDPHNWVVTLYDAQKYDSYGYEIKYYAVERTMVNFPVYDYAVGEYFVNGIDIGSRDEISDGYTGEEYVLAKERMDDVNTNASAGDYPNYALIENGKFVNSLEEEIGVRGQKIWASLPEGYSNTPSACHL